MPQYNILISIPIQHPQHLFLNAFNIYTVCNLRCIQHPWHLYTFLKTGNKPDHRGSKNWKITRKRREFQIYNSWKDSCFYASSSSVYVPFFIKEEIFINIIIIIIIVIIAIKGKPQQQHTKAVYRWRVRKILKSGNEEKVMGFT